MGGDVSSAVWERAELLTAPDAFLKTSETSKATGFAEASGRTGSPPRRAGRHRPRRFPGGEDPALP